MTFKDWLDSIIDDRLLCVEYMKKVASAGSKVQMMDIVLDANGIAFLPEMKAKTGKLPYIAICNEYRNYINGKYVRDKDGYTSSIYCMHKKPVMLNTTLTCFIASSIDVYVDEYDVKRIYIESNCNINVHVPASSRLMIDLWDGAHIDTCDSKGRIDIKRH